MRVPEENEDSNVDDQVSLMPPENENEKQFNEELMQLSKEAQEFDDSKVEDEDSPKVSPLQALKNMVAGGQISQSQARRLRMQLGYSQSQFTRKQANPAKNKSKKKAAKKARRKNRKK